MKVVEDLVSVMKRNITFYDEIYKDGNQFEVAAIANIQGEVWEKARLTLSQMIV
jgi:hypothetical protein